MSGPPSKYIEMTAALMRAKLIGWAEPGQLGSDWRQHDDHCWLNAGGKLLRILECSDGKAICVGASPRAGASARAMALCELDMRNADMEGYIAAAVALLRGSTH